MDGGVDPRMIYCSGNQTSEATGTPSGSGSATRSGSPSSSGSDDSDSTGAAAAALAPQAVSKAGLGMLAMVVVSALAGVML